MRLGILPAAGNSERWGGYPKELLPLPDDLTFLSRAVRSLKASGCDFTAVITNPSKIHLHAYHLKNWGRVLFAIQQGAEMWGAMTTALEVPADEYYFMMPDTYIPDHPFPEQVEGDFALGLFPTQEPERFGTLRDGAIVNKQPSVEPCLAWGALAWKRSVAEYWKDRSYADYTEAINDAMSRFGFTTWSLSFYHDIGSMSHYRRFLLAALEADEAIGEAPPESELIGHLEEEPPTGVAADPRPSQARTG